MSELIVETLTYIGGIALIVVVCMIAEYAIESGGGAL